MTNEAIEKIRQTEEDAAKCISDAKAAAAEKIRLAGLEAEEIVNAAEAEAARDRAAAEKTASDHAGDVLSRGAESARGEAKKTVAAAEPNMDSAVREIIGEIFEKWQ